MTKPKSTNPSPRICSRSGGLSLRPPVWRRSSCNERRISICCCSDTDGMDVLRAARGEFQMGDTMSLVHGSLDNHTNRTPALDRYWYQLASDSLDERWVGEKPA